MNPTTPILRATPNKIRATDIPKMDWEHRYEGFKVIPGRTEDKAQSMPANFGAPGPKRRKNPYAPA
jgi:hypothetical protein